jgi:cyanophycinase
MTLQRRTLLAAAALAPVAGSLAWSDEADGTRSVPATRRALVLGGGGRPYDPDMLDEFFRLAGGKNARIVVVPTAHPDMDRADRAAHRIAIGCNPWKQRGAREIVVRHTRDRRAAEAAAFLRALETATGVWLSGGDQGRLLETYRDTKFHHALLDVLRRGGVIGGSSAGCAVQSELAILGTRGERPLLEPGFNLLPGAVVDQHFLARGRQARLQRAIAEHPKFIGLGVDEHTTLVVERGTMRVLGQSTVSLYRADAGKLVSRTYRSGESIEI